jgi:hypothetical protein
VAGAAGRGLQARIERLANRAGDAACPVCGAGAGGPVAFAFDDTPGESRATDETTYCPGCGRVRRFTIAFDRADAE